MFLLSLHFPGVSEPCSDVTSFVIILAHASHGVLSIAHCVDTACFMFHLPSHQCVCIGTHPTLGCYEYCFWFIHTFLCGVFHSSGVHTKAGGIVPYNKYI